jgi:hypothetical protein
LTIILAGCELLRDRTSKHILQKLIPCMIDHDRLFKLLLTTFFWEFISLFFPAVTTYLERDTIIFLDKELFSDVTSGDRREVDLIAQAKYRNQDSFFLIHCEHQSHPAADFGKRMFHYFARLYEKYALPVYPIVCSRTTPTPVVSTEDTSAQHWLHNAQNQPHIKSSSPTKQYWNSITQ